MTRIPQQALLDQPFASSGETWVAATYLDVLTTDLPATGSDLDFIVASRRYKTLTTVRQWVQTGAAPAWSECSGLSPQLRLLLQFGNLSVDTEGRLWRRRVPPAMSSQLVVPARERQDLISRYHDSLFAGHLGISRTTYCLLDHVYWPFSGYPVDPLAPNLASDPNPGSIQDGSVVGGPS